MNQMHSAKAILNESIYNSNRKYQHKYSRHVVLLLLVLLLQLLLLLLLLLLPLLSLVLLSLPLLFVLLPLAAPEITQAAQLGK